VVSTPLTPLKGNIESERAKNARPFRKVKSKNRPVETGEAIGLPC